MRKFIQLNLLIFFTCCLISTRLFASTELGNTLLSWEGFKGSQQLSFFQQLAFDIDLSGLYLAPSVVIKAVDLSAFTSKISGKDFLRDEDFSQTPLYDATLASEGKNLATNHGLVALVGGAVENNGTIEANLDTFSLDEKGPMSLSFSDNDLVSFRVDSNSLAQEKKLKGGHVKVSAKTASGVLDNVINMNGHAQARSVSKTTDGKIVFHGASSQINTR